MTDPHTDHRALIARAIAVIGLLGIALIHLLDLQGKLEETPYLGIAYIVLIVGCVAVAGMLLHDATRTAWTLAFAFSLATLIGYVVNRTVGMPHATEDIGNWLEPLGLASLFVETCVVLVSGYALGVLTPSTASHSSSRSNRTMRTARAA